MEHFVFLEAGRDISSAFNYSYNPFLVIFSVLIASLAAYTAFMISERMSSNKQNQRQVRWAIIGAIALGAGVWSMHFIGMLAAQFPFAIRYDIPMTMLSLLPVTAASLVLLYNGIQKANLHKQLLLRSVIMGGGIGAMHYIGMMAMRMDAIMRYSPTMVMVSVLVAVVMAYISLYAKFWVDANHKKTQTKNSRLYAALIMGACISGMHYTGMAAVYFFPSAQPTVDSVAMNPETMAEIIGAMVVIFLGLLMTFISISKRLELMDKLKVSEDRMRAILNNVGEAIITIDKKGIIREFNQAAETIFGYNEQEAVGQNIKILMPEPYSSEHDGYIEKFLLTGEPHVIGMTRNIPGLRKDGSLITVEFTVTEMEIENQPWFTGLLRDVTEKVRQEKELEDYRQNLEKLVQERTEELEQAKDDAIAASKSKSQFLANMSHELRTPMNSIIGFTGRVLKKSGDLLPERQVKNLETVERNAHHLLSLINGLLDLSKIEAGKMELFLESFQLNALINEVADLTESLFSGKDVKFLRAPLSTDITLHSDKMKLKQILINLVGNSAKFTEHGSVQIIATSPDPDFVSISVKDSGVGMEQEELDQIFEAFHQVDGSMTRKIGGTGLGLAVTKSFTELLEGKITVESVKGEGTTMTVTIPVSSSKVKVVPDQVVNGDISSHHGDTVLCIDDDSDALDLLKGYLEDENFKVVTAQNGSAGIRLAKKMLPMAITLDVHMPQVDGWAVLNELKNDESTRNIPVIMVTMMDNIALGYELGATDYLQKPITSEVLLDSINNVVRRSVRYVLAVDDDPEVLELNRQILNDESIEVGTAEDGLKALESLSQRIPDLILLDLMMPNMDGFQFISRMKENDEWKDIPIIVVTAKTLTETERSTLHQGVQSVLTKEGTTAKQLLREISHAIRAEEEELQDA